MSTPRLCTAPLAVDEVGQYVIGDDSLGREHGRVEQVDTSTGRLLVGVRWDSGRLGWVAPSLLTVDRDHERTCARVATEQRTVDGIVCDLCAEHAAELDSETRAEAAACAAGRTR